MVLELKARTRAFLAALHRRDLTTCGDLLLQLAALTAVHPVTQVWHDYCAAVLYHEREANVAVAERRYRELLQTTDLDPFLAGQVQISLATAAMQTGAYGPAATAAQAAVNVFQVDEIRAAILDAARPGPGVAPGAWHARYGVGRIDATATLLSILSPTPQPVTVTASAASVP